MIEKIKKRGIDLKFKLITTSMLAFILFTGMGLIEDVQAAESLEDKKQNVQENLSEVEKDILKTSEKVNELNEKIEILEAAISSNEKDLKEEKINIKKNNEENTSELQSRGHLVCRLLLEKKNTHLIAPAVYATPSLPRKEGGRAWANGPYRYPSMVPLCIPSRDECPECSILCH